MAAKREQRRIVTYLDGLPRLPQRSLSGVLSGRRLHTPFGALGRVTGGVAPFVHLHMYIRFLLFDAQLLEQFLVFEKDYPVLLFRIAQSGFP
jgi:hypothetical protein